MTKKKGAPIEDTEKENKDDLKESNSMAPEKISGNAPKKTKKTKKTEVSPKDFQKLESRVSKLDQKVEAEIKKLGDKLTERMNSIHKKFTVDVTEIHGKIDNLDSEIKEIKNVISINTTRIKEQIDTQQEIITSMIKKFDEQFLKDKNKLTQEIEDVKTQQDVLRISYTINEKKLLEKIHLMIETTIAESVKSKEKEVLMKMWIDDLKEIVSDFEKLKKTHPKEFTLQLNEILATIQLFKQKLQA